MKTSERIAERLWEVKEKIEEEAWEYGGIHQDDREYKREWIRLVAEEIERFL